MLFEKWSLGQKLKMVALDFQGPEMPLRNDIFALSIFLSEFEKALQNNKFTS